MADILAKIFFFMRVTIFLVIYIEVFREYSIAYPQYITPTKSLKGLKDYSLNVRVNDFVAFYLILIAPWSSNLHSLQGRDK